MDSEPAFSELEEEFFRAGDAVQVVALDNWADVDPDPDPKPGLFARIFKRAPQPAPRRPSTERESEEDWDWQLAIARARHATHPGM